MRTLIFGLAIAAGFTTTSFAQNAVNIVAPSDGQQYPRNIPNGGNKVWVEFSFNTLCFDQFYKAEWYIDGQLRGSSEQMDENSVQYADVLPPGTHVLDVGTPCGKGSVKFEVKP